MATRADIECQNCQNTFQIFWHSFENQLPISCPYCDKSMSEKSVHMLENTLGATYELNKEIRKRHQELDEPLFIVSIQHVFVPEEKFDIDNQENV